MYHGHIINKSSDVVDEVTTVFMPAGRSYTGQDQAEIFCHGGQYVLKRILAVIFDHDVRPAEPGEFTRRAFLAGRIDLTRAEAVADLIASKTEFAYSAARHNLLGFYSERLNNLRTRIIALLSEMEAALDFPEEDFETTDRDRQIQALKEIINEIKSLSESYRSGKIIREGYHIAIAGRPNAGKSSLFNLLLNQNRAIIAPTPGTTRDYLTEWIDLGGVAVAITDTAGLRGRAGLIEKAGQETARRILKDADLVIWIVDIARRRWREELAGDLDEIPFSKDILIAINKIDKRQGFINDIEGAVAISCRNKTGLSHLKKTLLNGINIDMPDLTDRLVVTSERHRKKLDNCLKFLKKAEKGFKNIIPPELIVSELRSGINEIDEITGRIYNEEILEQIFSRFCIGK